MRRWTDTEVEILVGTLLRVGVVLAAAVVLLGACVYLWRHGADPVGAEYAAFHGEPRDLRGMHGIVDETLADRGRGIIMLGILFLIATPVARVGFSIFAFLAMRDRLYVVVSTYVLAVLLYSLVYTR